MPSGPPSRLAFTSVNCLFALLALRTNGLAPEVLRAAVARWLPAKAATLGQILVECGHLTPEQRQALERQVKDHLLRHQNDPKKALMSLGVPAATRDALLAPGDAEWLTCLACVSVQAAGDAPTVTAATASARPAGAGAAARPPADGPRYRVLRPHAKGGLGQVFVAQDQELHREVALKEIQLPFAHDERCRERFLLEAEVTGRLEHPGVVPVYGLGRYPDGRPYYAMRFVKGEDLKEAIRRFHGDRLTAAQRRLGLHQLLRRFVDVCNVMAYAHSRGVLHRDLKPANVMLGAYGETLVVDWGLARSVERSEADRDGGETTLRPDLTPEQATQLGKAIGTPAFMSPEQAAGRRDEVGPASDIFSLGATLYTLLTGQVPFQKATVQPATGVVERESLVPPRARKPGVPRALEAVCLKAMAERPADRYASALDLAADVEHWLADEPVSAWREPWPARAGRWLRRHRALALSVFTGVALVVAVLVAWDQVQRRQVEHARQQVVGQINDGLGREGEGLLEQAQVHFDAAARLCADRADLADLRDQAERLRDQAREAAGLQEAVKFEAVRRDVEGRLAQAGVEAQAGRLDQAFRVLNEAAALCRERSGLKKYLDQALRAVDQVERYRLFRQEADKVAAELTQGFGARDKTPDPVNEACRKALKVYGVLDRADWQFALTDTLLRPEQVAEVKGVVGEMLATLAIRTALYDTQDEAARTAARVALGYLDRLETLEGGSHLLWLLRDRYHRRLGEAAEAKRARGELARTPPRTAGDFYLLGSLTLQVAKKADVAADLYRQALRHNPRHFGALFGLYLCRAESDDAAGQLEPLTACLALRPADPMLYYLRGMVHFKRGDHDLAFLDFDAAVERDAAFALGYYYRGRMHIAVAQGPTFWADAEADLSRALALDPAFAAAYPWRAIAWAKLYQHRAAAADAESALKLDPKDGLTLVLCARAFAQAAQAARFEAAGPERDALVTGYVDRSVELLGRAAAAGFRDWGMRLEPGSDFDPVRQDPRFQALYQKARGAKD